MALFRKKCKNPIQIQWRFLKSLLHHHQHTEFGQRYDFASIQSIKEYQERVPIHSWDQISPYVEKIINGHKNVLFPASEKIIMFAATSGTTGEPKFIPITETSYRLFGKYWDHTWSNVSREAPKAAEGKVLYFPGDPEEGYFGNIPYGAITAKAYEQQSRIAKSLYPYPYQICKIKDYQLRYYTIMRIAIENEISLVAMANPSTINTLFRVAQEKRKEIIEDIRNGHLRNAEQIPEKLREMIQKRIRPNPKRARELEIIYEKYGDFLPRDYWKSLSAIICFSSGPLQLYLKSLTKWVGHIPIFDIGLLASESRFSFPLGSLQHQDGCCLTIETNFFEFIPEDQIDEPHPQVLTLDQCQRGKRYFILTTNYSGLYRYHISDLVEVTGFYKKVPLITFCNKGKHFSNITGEKITEFQITSAVRIAVEKTGFHIDSFTCCLHWDDTLPYYSILKGPNPIEDIEILQQFIDHVDEALMNMNIEYRSKRQSSRLGPLTLKIVRGNAYHDYENKKQMSCHNFSQYKQIFLINDPDFENQFQYHQQIRSSSDPTIVIKAPNGSQTILSADKRY
jgi:hypothetical protein